MGSAGDQTLVIVSGAGGHIGRGVCVLLSAAGIRFLPLDLSTNGTQGLIACDLTEKSEISRLFESYSIRAVIHLAAVLPSAFRRDPLTGVDVNLSGSVELLRQAIRAGTKRFVFASSMSVYGSSVVNRPLTENKTEGFGSAPGSAWRS